MKKIILIVVVVGVLAAGYLGLKGKIPGLSGQKAGSNQSDGAYPEDDPSFDRKAEGAKIDNQRDERSERAKKSGDSAGSTDSSSNALDENIPAPIKKAVKKSYATKEIQKDPELRRFNEGKLADIVPEVSWKLDKSACGKLGKTDKGTDFKCVQKIKKMGSTIVYEASYKDNKIVKLNSKIAGAKEQVSFSQGVSKRYAQKGKKAKKTNARAPGVIKFAFDGKNFLELYLDENYMVDSLQYHYFDLKQAVIRDDFYKEKDFYIRLEGLISSVEKGLKIIRFQCKAQSFEKACIALKKYRKINIKEDVKRIIENYEASKLESAFFD